MALKVTLDTNCFFDYYERDSTHLERLIHHAEQGTIDLAMTTRVKSDTYDRWQGEGESPVWVKIQSFPLIQTIGTAFRWDVSRLDSGDFFVSEGQSQLIDDLSDVLRQAQPEDIDHVAGHIFGRRDLFVTSDKHFLDYSQELLSRFGVLVLRPKDAADRIERMPPV